MYQKENLDDLTEWRNAEECNRRARKKKNFKLTEFSLPNS